MKRLYFIRHGQSELNVLGKFAGMTDTPLTKEGEQGALQAGKDSKDVGIDVILASPLSRAHNTAKLFAKGAGLPESMIQINDLLLERNFGILENTTWTREISSGLMNDNLPEGVEPWDNLVKRAQQLLDYVSSLPVDDVLLVGHGAIGRAIRSILEPDADYRAGIPNTELVRWV